MLTTQQVAELAGCGVDPVLRACRRGKIPGAKREIVYPEGGKARLAWQIPNKAGKEWAKNYVPHRRTHNKGRITANINPRTSPAPSSIPVTPDKQPPESEK